MVTLELFLRVRLIAVVVHQIVGTYGTLTIGADGSYTYTADQTAADDLDANDPATDVFTYTLTDENSCNCNSNIDNYCYWCE